MRYRNDIGTTYIWCYTWPNLSLSGSHFVEVFSRITTFVWPRGRLTPRHSHSFIHSSFLSPTAGGKASCVVPTTLISSCRMEQPVAGAAAHSAKAPAPQVAQSSKPKIPGIFKQVHQRHKRKNSLGEAPTGTQSILAILSLYCFNELLIFIPLSWVLHFRGSNETLTFICSFFAIIPLSKLLSFAIGDLAKRVGETLAGLIQATLGNTVELSVAIISLVHCELKVVQSSLIGSVICKLLLIPGLCFFAGGIRFSEQGLGASAAQINSSLLVLGVVTALLPATFHVAFRPEVPNGDNPRTDQPEAHDILAISHGVSLVLLFVYFCYLVFQLFSHKNLYEESDKTVQKLPVTVKEVNVDTTVSSGTSSIRRSSIEEQYSGRAERDLKADSVEEDEKPQMNVVVTTTLLIVTTVCLCITTVSLVGSIDGITSSTLISKEFVGFILLPFLGNAEEITIAIKESVKDKLTLTLGVAVGSSIQITFFVVPFVTTLAWILGKPLTLLFDPIEPIVLFLSVLAVNYVVRDEKSDWLEGIFLICHYMIVAVTFWYYAGSDPSALASCAS
ncbi:calcium proton exchanger [Lactarius hatsudake]|nr:calcium proton exchanger [Lactarius hatsudake]